MAVRSARDGIRRAVAEGDAFGAVHPTTAAGVAGAATVCAVAWYSSGTTVGQVVGGCALCGGWLVLAAVWRRRVGASASESPALASEGDGRPAGRVPDRGPRQSRTSPGAAGAGPVGGSGAAGPAAAPETGSVAADAGEVGERRAADAVTAAVCLAAEAAVYAGAAAGAPAATRDSVWRLAIAALVLIAIRQMMPSFGPSADPARLAAEAPVRAAWRWAGWLLSFPLAARFALIVVATPIAGAHTAFVGLLAGDALALMAGLVRSAWTWARSGLEAGIHGQSDAGPAGERDSTGAWDLAGGTKWAGGSSSGARLRRANPSLATARGDGLLARAVGMLARHQVAPLPPALAGAASTVVLAVVGMAGLPWPLLLAPMGVMFLAAAGAGHPHDGPFDWLVPPTLRVGEFAYIAGLGLAGGVPAPLTFAFICVLASMHLTAGKPAVDEPAARRLTVATRGDAWWVPLGWEGRMLLLGLTTVAGVAAFTYLLLTAYLGFLAGRAALTGWTRAVRGRALLAAEVEGQ